MARPSLCLRRIPPKRSMARITKNTFMCGHWRPSSRRRSGGLPVNTQFGYLEIKGLERELRRPKYQNATIFVAWEHYLLDDFVKDLVKTHGGDPTQVPPWPHDDFDSIFVVKITRSGGRETVAFTIDHENLNNLSDTCP